MIAPALISTIALIVVSTLGTYQLHRSWLQAEHRRSLSTVRALIQDRMDTESAHLGLALDVVLREPNVVPALTEADSAALATATRMLFTNLRQHHRITDVQFIDAQRRVLHRAHDPVRNGDLLDRYTINQAFTTGERTSGLELGARGGLSLRVVHPVTKDGQTVGVVEIGREFEHISDDLRRAIHVEIHAAVRKNLLNRAEWEAGQRQRSRTPNWDLLPTHVLSGHMSNGSPPGPALAEALHQAASGQAEITTSSLGTTLLPLRDASGHHIGAIAVIQDTSAERIELVQSVGLVAALCILVLGLLFAFLRHRLRYLEDELDKAEVAERTIHKELELRAAKRKRELSERTKQLTEQMVRRQDVEQRLRHTHKMEAIGQLTGGIAHDFNNLLAVIVGTLDLLRGSLGPSDAELLEDALQAADRGSTLTRDLLAFGRKQILSPHTLDLAALLGSTSNLLSRTLGDHIELDVLCPPDLWGCRADSAQLQNAIVNLAINARDAMTHGGHVTIETSNVVLTEEQLSRWALDGGNPGDYVCIAVIDDGPGMSPEIADRAFDPFFTTKPVGSGSGLGLSMVYGFVVQSGGHIDLHSTEQGTRIELYLPRAKPQHDTGGHLAAPSLPPQSGCVLVVEDHDQMRRLLLRQLISLGYQPRAAADAHEALTILRTRQDLALLLTDVVLRGGVNGFELAEQAVKLRPSLRVAYISGYAQDALATFGGSHHDLKILAKPFHIRELADHLTNALEDTTSSD